MWLLVRLLSFLCLLFSKLCPFSYMNMFDLEFICRFGCGPICVGLLKKMESPSFVILELHILYPDGLEIEMI